MIVLDTHIWVWWVDGSERLTKKHRQYIEEYQSQGLGVSIVSCWEVAKLVEKNRLVFSCPINEWLEAALAYLTSCTLSLLRITELIMLVIT